VTFTTARPSSGVSRCVHCHRPIDRCYCDLIPDVDNETPVLILQHRREREHPFNTARMVAASLSRCDLVVDHVMPIAERIRDGMLSQRAALLYPGADVPLLGDLAASESIDQLVVLDGTWHHTKTMMRDIPGLATLPRFQLAPSQPGRYRIRREPTDQALSTLEATADALQVLAPENETLANQLDALRLAFDKIIDGQLACPKSNWRKNERRTPGASNVPKVILNEPERIVVVYIEQEQGTHVNRGDRLKDPSPVYWMAQRLDTGKTFSCAIQNECLSDDYFLNMLRLSQQDVDGAVDLQDFQSQWRRFLKVDDVLVVNHSGNAKMIDRVGATDHDVLVLKSITSLPDVDETTISPIDLTRAAERLAMAVAKVPALRVPS
jgi:hypothetical protein